MSKIRELFHKIGNLHNKISVGAGLTKAEIKSKFKDNPLPQEIERTIKRLTELEQIAVKAGKDLRQLKERIYRLVDPDAGKPKKKGGR